MDAVFYVKSVYENSESALSGLSFREAVATQGGASLCPGLLWRCPFGAFVTDSKYDARIGARV